MRFSEAARAARFVFLIGYMALVADGGEKIVLEREAGHSVRKPGFGDWRELHVQPRKSGVNWRKRWRRRKETQKASDFTNDPNDAYLWTCLRAFRKRAPVTLPRNILTKDRGYTISLFKE
jgi:hypothetical protein